MLKTRRGGYDGKGQATLREPGDVERAWSELGGVPLVLESHVPFDRELSVLAVRGRDGATACWPLVENHHDGGILRRSFAPAPGVTERLQATAEQLVGKLLDELEYVGVLAVELFDVHGELLVNELAPRVHNSGHWTIEGAVTSQFENHLRAILGWPLGSTTSDRRERDGELRRRPARSWRGARDPGRPLPRLREGATPGPQGRPRHDHRGKRRRAAGTRRTAGGPARRGRAGVTSEPLSPYVRFTRDEWARLRAATPLTLTEDDLEQLRGINERIALDEVADIYLALSRLLNLYVAASQNLHRVTDTFLGSPAATGSLRHRRRRERRRRQEHDGAHPAGAARPLARPSAGRPRHDRRLPVPEPGARGARG